MISLRFFCTTLFISANLVFYLSATAMEKPLPVKTFIVATRQKDLGPGDAFQDSKGYLWYKKYDKLLSWDGKKRSWEQTPVKMKPHPFYDYHFRSGAPWLAWQQPLHVMIGQNGVLLAVTVRDIYQDMSETEAFALISGRASQELQQRLITESKRNKPFWLEGWLYNDGSWVGSLPIEELLHRHRQLLLKAFVGQTEASSFFDLQSDGEHLWFAAGSKVSVLDGDGRSVSWTIPGSDKGLLSINLVLLPDGSLWCAHGEKGITALRLVREEIEAQPLSDLERSNPLNLPPRFHVSRDKTVWAWPINGRIGQLSDGKWLPRPDLGYFLLEDSDRGLWFLPGGESEGSWSWAGYHVLKNGRHTRIPLPGNFVKGSVTPAGPGMLFAACSDRIFTLVGSGTAPSGWKVKSVLGLKSIYETGKLFKDGHGNLVGESGWSAQLPRR